MPFSKLKSSISLPWFFLVVVVVLLVAIVPHFDVRIEDVQFVLFPLFVLGVFLLPKLRGNRIPLPYLGIALFCWLGSAAYVEGLIRFDHGTHAAYITRLRQDEDGMKARSLFIRLNEIARTYHLQSVALLDTSYDSVESLRTWMAQNSVPIAIRGSEQWLEIGFLSGVADYLAPYLKAIPKEPHVSTASLEAWKLHAGKDVLLRSVPGLLEPLALTFLPERIALPGQPEELARHWLAWLISGIVPTELERDGHVRSAQKIIARQLDALNEASLISGPWKTNTPLSLSDHLYATLLLTNSDPSSPAEIDEALSRFRAAAGKVDKNAAGELFSSIFNNAAVALLMSSDDENDLNKAKRWLEIAVGVESKLSIPTNSTVVRTTLYNLSVLDSVVP